MRNIRFELIKARKEAGLTQRQIADMLGIERTKYTRIELGKMQNVPVTLAIKIACLVNKPIEKLFAS